MSIIDYSIPKTLWVALLGMAIVFAALTVLILLMQGLTRATAAKHKGTASPKPAPEPEPEQGPVVNRVPAKGSLGEVALYGVDDRTAALIMAIVADELQKPLNELRFRSIREREAGKGVSEV